MEKRSLAAIALCIAFYFAYTQYLKTKYPNYGRPQLTEQIETGAAPTSPAAAIPQKEFLAKTPQEIVPLDPALLLVETPEASFQFSQETGGLQAVRLKGYRQEAKGEEPVSVLSNPLSLWGVIGPEAPLPVVGPQFHAERGVDVIKFWREQDGVRITQEYRVPQAGYGFDFDVSFTNISANSIDLVAGVVARERVEFKDPKKLLGFLPGAPAEIEHVVTSVEGDQEQLELRSFCEKGETFKTPSSGIQYFGLDKHYFMSLLLPKAKTMHLRITAQQETKSACRLTLASYEPQGQLAPQQTVTLKYRSYFGPKDLKILSGVEDHLEHAVNFGIFGFIARPLLYVIQGFNEKIFHNYGLAIIFLTILLKILFFPLMQASAESMHRMKTLQPQMKAIQERFKDDRAKLNQELMKFYAQHKINPMKGCLPILPQIPVFFAFYQVLQNAIELRHAPFYGWIHDLSSMDPYLVTPLLMGVAMFAQQKLTPQAGMDKTQEKILMFMPIMFTVMMLTLPAGLTLYMLTNTITGIAQQQWVTKKLNQRSMQQPLTASSSAQKTTKAKA